MQSSNWTMSTVTALLSAVLALTSCARRQTVYYHYEHTPTAGWEKGDSVSFDVGPLKEAGNYSMNLCIRIDNSFPFLGITMAVKHTTLPSGKANEQTIECRFMDDNGIVEGNGISRYQYSFPLKSLALEAGDSLHITVAHDMKREMLPGITDIGLIVEKR